MVSQIRAPESISNNSGGGYAGGLSVRRTHILVGDDLHADHVASGFKDLLEDVLSDPRVQPTHIQGSLVWFRSRSADISTSACGGHHINSGHGRGHGGGNRIGILGNYHRGTRGRGHMGLVALAIALRSIVLLGLTDSGLRRGGERRGSRGLSVFSHYDFF